MRSLSRTALAALCLFTALPAFAQMSFEGLDLGGAKTKKKKTPPPPPKKVEPKKDPGTTGSEVELPAGGLDLGKPTGTGTKTGTGGKAGGSSPTMSFDAVDVSGKTGDRQKLDAAINQFKNDQFDQAAVAFYDMSVDPAFAGLAAESEYWLGKSLYKLGMYHSSLQQFSKVLARGQSTKFFKSSLEWLFFIARKTINETVVLDEIAKYNNAEFPERFRSEFRYLMARYNFVRGKALDDAEQKGDADAAFSEVKRLALMVPKGDPFYPRAKYLEGLSYFRENKPETALEAMKEVIRVTRVPPGPITNEVRAMQTLRELAFMQLARTHYGAKQNRYAIFYFSKIERGGPQWLESLFESSWANYRVGQYEQSLGNLITLSSPFFRDEYFPEALILKAVIYFENCRYREAISIIEDFDNIYAPVHDELEALVQKNMEASQYFSVFDDVRKRKAAGLEVSGTQEILERILNLALTDKDLKKTSDSITELESEIDAMSGKSDAFKYSSLAKALIEQLKAQRQVLIEKAGFMAKSKLEFELRELKTLRANGLRIKFETTTKEKDYIEQQMGAQAGASVDQVKLYKTRWGVPDDYLYWPYVGEYWRDELGTYQYALTKGCIERQARAGGGE